MGWAAGVERMLMASTQAPPGEPPVDLYVAYEPGHKEAAFKLAADARQRRRTAQDSNSPGAASRASSSRRRAPAPRYVAIFGDDGVQLRDRDGGEDKLVAPETVMHHIRGNIL